MSDTTSTPGRISTASAVLILGLAFLAVLLVLGLVWIMGPENGEPVLRWVTGLVTLATGGAAGGAALMARRAASGVEVVRKQTNGVMDQRIRDGVTQVLTEAGLVDRRTSPSRAIDSTDDAGA